jgi:hypothetical protein
MPAQRFHHRDARHHRIASTHRDGTFDGVCPKQVGCVGFRMRCSPSRQDIRLEMTKTGSIASSSFDTGATVALIGNGVGYVGSTTARPLFKAQC